MSPRGKLQLTVEGFFWDASEVEGFSRLSDEIVVQLDMLICNCNSNFAATAEQPKRPQQP